MIRQTLAPKFVGETELYSLDFASVLPAGVSISSISSISSAVFSGVDPTPSGLLAGVATVVGTRVSQLLTAGIPGVVYDVSAIVLGTDGEKYELGGFVAIYPIIAAPAAPTPPPLPPPPPPPVPPPPPPPPPPSLVIFQTEFASADYNEVSCYHAVGVPTGIPVIATGSLNVGAGVYAVWSGPQLNPPIVGQKYTIEANFFPAGRVGSGAHLDVFLWQWNAGAFGNYFLNVYVGTITSPSACVLYLNDETFGDLGSVAITNNAAHETAIVHVAGSTTAEWYVDGILIGSFFVGTLEPGIVGNGFIRIGGGGQVGGGTNRDMFVYKTRITLDNLYSGPSFSPPLTYPIPVCP